MTETTTKTDEELREEGRQEGIKEAAKAETKLAIQNEAVVASTAAIAQGPSRDERAASVAQSIEQGKREIIERARPADIAPAKVGQLSASGTFIEDGVKKLVDVASPAVDNNPRAGTTERMNQIDFNDPFLRDHEAVEQQLRG